MLYDIRLHLRYEYESPVVGGRHLVRVMPSMHLPWQRLVAASFSFEPEPVERSDFTDFFANAVTAIVLRDPHDCLDVGLHARVAVQRPPPMLDTSPNPPGLRREFERTWSLSPTSPQHFLPPSRHAPIKAEITRYARDSLRRADTVARVAEDLCARINRDFTYDAEATEVSTPVDEAFQMRRGVCQDFSHIMIAGLRGIGIPAGYVSGYLRTIPPRGKERLEGADAMHAWVKVWCGETSGWIEFDPTNDMLAGDDHITVATGRDYDDVPPIVGVLVTSGDHKASQSVDVLPIGEPSSAPARQA